MDIMKLIEWMPQHKTAVVTDVIALGAIAAPWWWSALKETSEVAGMLLPIAGVIWLAVQIVAKIKTTWGRHHDDDEADGGS